MEDENEAKIKKEDKNKNKDKSKIIKPNESENDTNYRKDFVGKRKAKKIAPNLSTFQKRNNDFIPIEKFFNENQGNQEKKIINIEKIILQLK